MTKNQREFAALREQKRANLEKEAQARRELGPKWAAAITGGISDIVGAVSKPFSILRPKGSRGAKSAKSTGKEDR